MFKFSRLVLGIKVAPTIFQQVMDTMLSGLDFAVTYIDDILLKIKNPEEQKMFSRFSGFKTMDSS